MKKNKYEVYFFEKFVVVWANNEREATILAQARMISDGLNYEVHSIKKIK